MDRNAELYFKLRKQQLIELIKQNKTSEAIKFAQTKVAPKCITSNLSVQIQYQKELELVMSLLMFEDSTKITTQKLKDLVQQSSLQDLASEVNRQILTAHGFSCDLKLNFYWQMLQWCVKNNRKLPNNLLDSLSNDC